MSQPQIELKKTPLGNLRYIEQEGEIWYFATDIGKAIYGSSGSGNITRFVDRTKRYMLDDGSLILVEARELCRGLYAGIDRIRRDKYQSSARELLGYLGLPIDDVRPQITQQSDISIFEHTFQGETEPAVNARDVWAWLEVKTVFARWITRRIQDAQLVDGEDFIFVPNLADNPSLGKPATDYILSLDAAKHIGMLEGNVKGHQLRKYFIEYEKRARKVFRELQEIEEDPLITMARKHVALQREQYRQSVEIAEHRLQIEQQRLAIEKEREEREKQQRRIEKQEDNLRSMEAKTDAVLESDGYFTIAAYARRRKMPMPLLTAQKLGRVTSNICRRQEIPIQTRPHSNHGEVNSYPEELLKDVFDFCIEERLI